MAVLTVGGCWLPRGLTFGPTNGPEDFQELVFIVFARRLYRDWYLFIDDICVATGRKEAIPPGPTGKHDVWGSLTESSSPSPAVQEALRAYAVEHRAGPKAGPPLFKRVVRFLHLFSGPSRRGDLKDELFIRGLELNILIIVEDWDTVHSRSHDMTMWERVAGLLEMIAKGWFNGGHCSPPCNTFSAVLFICLLYTSPSPRDGLLSRMPSSA